MVISVTERLVLIKLGTTLDFIPIYAFLHLLYLLLIILLRRRIYSKWYLKLCILIYRVALINMLHRQVILTY
jgi:hypothetical protein